MNSVSAARKKFAYTTAASGRPIEAMHLPAGTLEEGFLNRACVLWVVKEASYTAFAYLTCRTFLSGKGCVAETWLTLGAS